MARTNFDEMMMMQASKWDLNFGGQLAINSKNLVDKYKKLVAKDKVKVQKLLPIWRSLKSNQ
jgi:hypothetical protein